MKQVVDIVFVPLGSSVAPLGGGLCNNILRAVSRLYYHQGSPTDSYELNCHVSSENDELG